MSYHVEYSDTALKQLKKMDRFEARLITSWISKNLEGCSDPRIHGKGLTTNRSGEWRYRIGNYRACASSKMTASLSKSFPSDTADTSTSDHATLPVCASFTARLIPPLAVIE